MKITVTLEQASGQFLIDIFDEETNTFKLKDAVSTKRPYEAIGVIVSWLVRLVSPIGDFKHG